MPKRLPWVSTSRWRLRPQIFFPRVVAFFRATNRTGFDRLTVDHCRARFRISPLFFAHLFAERLQDAIPNPFALPATKVVIDGSPGRKLMRQQAPRTPTPKEVEDG